MATQGRGHGTPTLVPFMSDLRLSDDDGVPRISRLEGGHSCPPAFLADRNVRPPTRMTAVKMSALRNPCLIVLRECALGYLGLFAAAGYNGVAVRSHWACCCRRPSI